MQPWQKFIMNFKMSIFDSYSGILNDRIDIRDGSATVEANSLNELSLANVTLTRMGSIELNQRIDDEFIMRKIKVFIFGFL